MLGPITCHRLPPSWPKGGTLGLHPFVDWLCAASLGASHRKRGQSSSVTGILKGIPGDWKWNAELDLKGFHPVGWGFLWNYRRISLHLTVIIKGIRLKSMGFERESFKVEWEPGLWIWMQKFNFSRSPQTWNGIWINLNRIPKGMLHMNGILLNLAGLLKGDIPLKSDGILKGILENLLVFYLLKRNFEESPLEFYLSWREFNSKWWHYLGLWKLYSMLKGLLMSSPKYVDSYSNPVEPLQRSIHNWKVLIESYRIPFRIPFAIQEMIFFAIQRAPVHHAIQTHWIHLFLKASLQNLFNSTIIPIKCNGCPSEFQGFPWIPSEAHSKGEFHATFNEHLIKR